MDVAQILVILAGSTVLSTLLTAIVNGLFQVRKGKAETDGTKAKTSVYFDELAGKWTERFEIANKRLEERIQGLEDAITELIGSVDRAIPALEALAGRDDATVVELRQATMRARRIV